MNYENKLSLAISMAEEKHGDQEYGDGVPYLTHLLHVQQVVSRFGQNPFSGDKEAEDLNIAAILHDIVEDTDVTLVQVKKIFGKRVASLVNGVTNESGVNRKERHRKTYPKTKRIPGALYLKLADRIANIESCIASGDSRIGMYKKEHDSFVEALKVDGEHDRMWRYIDKLLFGKR